MKHHSHHVGTSPISPGVALMNLWQALIRATAALLLMATLVTPALAEVACAEESVVHLQEAVGVTAAAGDMLSSPPQQQDQNESGSPAGHCAFTHGHCAGITVLGSAAASISRIPMSYALTRATPLAPGAVDTPHHPPNA